MVGPGALMGSEGLVPRVRLHHGPGGEARTPGVIAEPRVSRTRDLGSLQLLELASGPRFLLLGTSRDFFHFATSFIDADAHASLAKKVTTRGFCLSHPKRKCRSSVTLRLLSSLIRSLRCRLLSIRTSPPS
jgi:hypothetical protein